MWLFHQGIHTSLVEVPQPPSETATPAPAPKEPTAKEIPQESTWERKCLKFPRWEKVLHPSQPVAVAGQPSPSKSQEQTYPLEAICHQSIDVAPPELTAPPWESEAAHQWAPMPRFLEVTTCLRGQMQEGVHKTPHVPLVVGMMMTLGIATMSASCVVHDEATGATYLDM